MNRIKQTTILAMLLLLSACAAPITDVPVIAISPSPTLPVFLTVRPDDIMIDDTPVMTPESIDSATPTPTPELVDPLAWMSEAEGKILFQMGELNLFDRDQFTVNPELAEKLYGDVLLKFVYAVNRAGDVDGFAKTYPTYEVFAKMVAENPGKTYDDLQLLDQHPDARGGTKSAVYGEWLPAGKGVILDKIVVDLATPEEAMASGDFIRIEGSVGFRMDTIEIDGTTVFRYTFTELLQDDREDLHLTTLSKLKTPEENAKTLTMAINLFAEVARRSAGGSLVPNEGIVLVGKDPDAMDLIMGLGAERARAAYLRWADGEQYFILADNPEVSWEQRLDLYNASTLFGWIRMLVG